MYKIIPVCFYLFWSIPFSDLLTIAILLEMIILKADGIYHTNDQLKNLDHVVYLSSLRIFKGIKESLKRCTSFSTSRALFDL